MLKMNKFLCELKGKNNKVTCRLKCMEWNQNDTAQNLHNKELYMLYSYWRYPFIHLLFSHYGMTKAITIVIKRVLCSESGSATLTIFLPIKLLKQCLHQRSATNKPEFSLNKIANYGH